MKIPSSILPAVLALALSSLTLGCYTELDGEREYDCVETRADVRVPNSPPGAATGNGAAPATTCDPDGAPPAPPTAAPPTPGTVTPPMDTAPAMTVEPPPPVDPFANLPAGCSNPPSMFGNEDNCGGLVCHGSASGAGAYVDLGYDSIGLVDRLMDAPGIATCETFKLIDSADPSNSLLILKLEDPAICGEAMPYSGRTITPEQRECIIAWTLAAAASAAP